MYASRVGRPRYMNAMLLLVAGVLGLLSFFEPCTIATHALFAARAYAGPAAPRRQALMQLLLSRVLLLSALFATAAAIGWERFSAPVAIVMLGVMGAVYLISRKLYLPVPHAEFFRLLPAHADLTQAYKLGSTLPACTLPLVLIVALACALHQRPFIAALAGLVFALMFTLPTLWDSTYGLDAAHRAFLSRAADASPYITAALLWGGALLIWQTGN